MSAAVSDRIEAHVVSREQSIGCRHSNRRRVNRFDFEPLRVVRRGRTYVLSLALPFADRDDLEVGRRHDELFVRVGPYRRAIRTVTLW